MQAIIQKVSSSLRKRRREAAIMPMPCKELSCPYTVRKKPAHPLKKTISCPRPAKKNHAHTLSKDHTHTMSAICQHTDHSDHDQDYDCNSEIIIILLTWQYPTSGNRWARPRKTLLSLCKNILHLWVNIWHHDLCMPTDWGLAKQMLVGRVLSRSFSI